jgi:hypothetical protein
MRQPFYGNIGRRTSAGGFDARLQKVDEQREKGSRQDPSLICSGADAGLVR